MCLFLIIFFFAGVQVHIPQVRTIRNHPEPWWSLYPTHQHHQWKGIPSSTSTDHQEPSRTMMVSVSYPSTSSTKRYSTFKYGPSGTIQNHDGLCILPTNIINEKVFQIPQVRTIRNHPEPWWSLYPSHQHHQRKVIQHFTSTDHQEPSRNMMVSVSYPSTSSMKRYSIFSSTDHQEPSKTMMVSVSYPSTSSMKRYSTFHKYGPSGTIKKHDGLCILPINIINKKVFHLPQVRTIRNHPEPWWSQYPTHQHYQWKGIPSAYVVLLFLNWILTMILKYR